MRIKIMPTKELLEDFLKGLHGEGDGTYFDIKKGEFISPSVKKKTS
jgi:hypothetical protein